MKKCLVLVTAIILFFLPVHNSMFPNQAHAITGKVVTLTAKKMAKELIKDSAVEMASDFAVKNAMDIIFEYQVKEGFTAVCLPGDKLPDGDCSRPMQIKTNLSETDKTNIGDSISVELDKAVNGGKEFTRFQKFVDFVAPLFLLSLAVTAITYAMDGDVRALFNEIATKALTALGILAPLEDPTKPKDVNPIESVSIPENRTTSVSVLELNGVATNSKAKNNGYTIDNIMDVSVITEQQKRNLMIKASYYNTGASREGDFPNNKFEISDNVGINGYLVTIEGSNVIKINDTRFGTINNVTEIKNGQVKVYTASTVSSGQRSFIVDTRSLTPQTSAVFRMPYFNGTFWITDLYLNTNNPSIPNVHYQIQHSANNIDYTFTQVRARANYTGYAQYEQYTGYMTVDTTQNPFRETLLPPVEELAPLLAPLETSRYRADETTVTLVPPSSFPYERISTGTPVYPQDVPNGEPIFVDEDGNPVDGEDVQPLDPNISDGPDGKPQVQPPPSPSNPTPEPIPLTPPVAPPTPEPPIETEPPKYPEGEGCEQGLKLPKIKPLTQAVTTAFPFSIPFDLYKGFQALFSEIGTEKPSFNLVIGDSIDWEISIPNYFDSWKTFSDGVLIFVFDVGLIYAIYRFMSGGGS